MVQYDSKIIYRYAQQLYNQANALIALCLLLGAIGGAVAGASLAPGDWPKAVGAIIGAAIGLLIGVGLSFHVKLKAQIMLCQVKIEENTRSNTSPATVG